MKQAQLMILIGALIVLVVIGVTLWTVWSYSKTLEEHNTPTVQERNVPIIGIFDVKEKLEDTTQESILVDVRSEEDFEAGHVKGAINIPINTFREGAYSSLPVSSEIIVMCYGDSCEFSTEAAEILNKAGYTNVFDMTAGIAGWIEADLPIIEAQSGNESNTYKVGVITANDAVELLNNTEKNNTIFILDVRSEAEYKKEHIDQSTNIPLARIEQDYNNIPRGKQIMIIAETESEGEEAGATLFDLQFLSIVRVEGGYAALRDTEIQQ